jgi:G3E family GTPase
VIPLALITGFLGSGKTTFLEHLAQRYRARKIVWLVNEFSARDMDSARLSAQAKDVISVVGGSIFCRCKAAEFLEQLRSLPERFGPDAVVVEASGMADPLVAGKLLHETGLDRLYAISAVVALVDPATFLKLCHTLPAIRAQIETATHVLLNKTDLHPPERLTETETAVRALNASAPILRTRYTTVDLELFGAQPPMPSQGDVAPCVDPHFSKFEATLTRELDLDWLRQAVETVRDEVYRVKGVVLSGGRRYHLDYSASGWQMKAAADTSIPALVMIARGAPSEAVSRLFMSISAQAEMDPKS